MASLLIESIRSALNALESLEKSESIVVKYWLKNPDLKIRLKNLELFGLCARKLRNDAQLIFYDGKVSTLASLLQKIHDVLPATPYHWDGHTLYNFASDIDNFKEEIGGWYNTLLVSLPQPTFDQVTELIDSVLEHLNYLISPYEFSIGWFKKQHIEALIEKITFLRNFIRFATLRSVEPPQLLDNLLVHIQAVAVDAARTSYICIFQRDDVKPNFPALPQVDETYTEALTSSKLSTQLHSPIPDKDHDPSVIMKDFIDSLLWNLWERLHIDTPIVISTNSELRLVYEGLRLLRSMLKEQPNRFDKKIGELTRVVICDAGIMIFSLCQRDMEIAVPDSGLPQRINRITQIVNGKDFSFPDFLPRISHIRQRVEGKDLSFPDLLQRIHSAGEQMGGNDLPRTNELGFIDFVLENLLEMTSSEARYGFQSQFRMIHNELSSLRFSLGEIVVVRDEQKELAALWNDGVKVAYRVEYLIDQLVFGDFQGSSSTSFDSTVEDILKEVESIYSKIHPAPDIKVKKLKMTPNPVLSQNRAPVADEIVGFDDDITSIIDRLTGGSRQLKMVAIVGMPGIGKTTLATKVFNDPYVTFRFDIRLQCCVSHLFHKKKLLLELLSHVDTNRNNEQSEQELTAKLWRHLKDKKYLIFLDDVWDIEAWNSLKASFPVDLCESRILVTSRHRHAVPQAMLDKEPLSLHPLTEDQSWELMQKKLPPRNGWPLELDDVGKRIAANCKGLPLTVVVVAGHLANTEPRGWDIFLESISSVSGADHCMDTLELSYNHLPGHLKQCFLYFGLFPEDHQVSVEKLIRLWIAEGFVRRTESKSLEDVARDYVMDLAGRSLVIVSKKRFRGGVKACQIHDLLHDFCGIKAKDENFFQSIKGGYDEFVSFEEPDYLWRLCVHSERKHFKNLRLFCPRLHSLLFFGPDKEGISCKRDISFIIRRYIRLRVLDMDDYRLSFWNGIPEIGLFLQLKYLSVWPDNSDIPSSIGSLINLETFILQEIDRVSMPDTFWDLQKLRHVDVEEGGFRLGFENLEKFPDLCELQSCSTAIIGRGESIERLVRKFPNICKLRCELDWEDSDEIEILIPDSLWKLESLGLTSGRTFGLLSPFKFDLPDNLRKLSLFQFRLNQRDVSMIGKLANLEVLKLHFVDFHENRWDMVEGEFTKLRFLSLSDSRIARWTASEHQFRRLEKLALENCCDLEEIPHCDCYCFENMDTIEVIYCCDTVERFFQGIQDEQRELEIRFRISKSEDEEISGLEEISSDE